VLGEVSAGYPDAVAPPPDVVRHDVQPRRRQFFVELLRPLDSALKRKELPLRPEGDEVVGNVALRETYVVFVELQFSPWCERSDLSQEAVGQPTSPATASGARYQKCVNATEPVYAV
jgi:hypothetical protein